MQRIVHLTPPLLADEHIKEKIVCIRAHRERLFYVALQQQHEKLIFHNYGQGGAGWTFLFGCVHESLRQFEARLEQQPALRAQPITVIGAGCYGLLTAIMLKRAGHAVCIVAKELHNIPSHKAAGFFFPRPRKSSTLHECAIFAERGIESYATYQQIISGTHPFIAAGPKVLPAYFGLDIDPGFGPYIERGLMAAPEQVTIDFGNGKRYDAMEYQTVFINTAAIMQELLREIDELGISITPQEISAFDEIAETIIFNCAGLGAKQLTNDHKVIPVQGHLITLCNQSDLAALQYMINVKIVQTDAQGNKRDELIYYAPKESGILGISFKRGQDSLTTNFHEFDRLLARSRDYFGS